jgi:hypothetical protein
MERIVEAAEEVARAARDERLLVQQVVANFQQVLNAAVQREREAMASMQQISSDWEYTMEYSEENINDAAVIAYEQQEEEKEKSILKRCEDFLKDPYTLEQAIFLNGWNGWHDPPTEEEKQYINSLEGTPAEGLNEEVVFRFWERERKYRGYGRHVSDILLVI